MLWMRRKWRNTNTEIPDNMEEVEEAEVEDEEEMKKEEYTNRSDTQKGRRER